MLQKELSFDFSLSSKDIKKGLKFPTQVSQDIAYICGVLVGDGSIYTRKIKNDYIIKCVGNPKDEKQFYFKVIGPFFKRIFGFTPKMKLHDSGTTFGFVIYSKSLFTFLTRVVGLLEGKKDERLKIPKILNQKKWLIPFIRGVFDTDGCISFKKRYKQKPYYPVITLSSKSKRLIIQISEFLKSCGFMVVEIYDYKLNDLRIKKKYTIINRIELNGMKNLKLWCSKICFFSPKHKKKIKKWDK